MLLTGVLFASPAARLPIRYGHKGRSSCVRFLRSARLHPEHSKHCSQMARIAVKELTKNLDNFFTGAVS